MRLASLVVALLVGPVASVAQVRTVPVTLILVVPRTEHLAGLDLAVTPLPGGTSVLTVTDSTGRATLSLAPGRYRVQSLRPLQVAGIERSWDMEVTVTATYATAAILLTAQNATLALAPEAPASPVPALAPRSTHVSGLGPMDRGYRNPDMALLFGLLLTGGGHMYSGEVANGFGFLLGTGALVGVAVATCGVEECNKDLTAGALIGALGLVIYSWVDAPAAAKRTNRKGFPRLSLGPMEVTPTGRGVAFSMPIR